MRNKVPLCVARVARIGALLTAAVLAAVMMAGPAGAHHGSGHGRGNETATFDVTASGDVSFVGVGEDPPGANSSQVHLHDENTPTANLSFFFDKFDGDGANCFSTSTPANMLIGRRDTDGVAVVAYRFDALDKDGGTTGIRYVLLMTGTFDGDFPPALNDTSTLTLDRWEMGHSGGPGKKVACTGEGDFGTVVTVVVTRTN